jgi:TonB family protein
MEARKSRWKSFIILSIVGHILVVLVLLKIKNPTVPEEQVVYIDVDPKLVDEAKNNAKQIVQTDKAGETKIAPDAKFLSERDQAVEKQTKAKTVDRFRSAETNGQQSKGTKGTKGLSLKDLAANPNFDPTTPKEQDGRKVAQEKQTESGSQGAAGSASSDYLRDIQEGEKTALSTREFKFFGYHQRIRERLEVAWNGQLKDIWTNYMLGGRRPSSAHDYVTRLYVVMDRHGEIVAVKLLEESGARDLDRAAVEAFNKIGPFPDPPSGIVGEDGTFKIPWSFVVSL